MAGFELLTCVKNNIPVNFMTVTVERDDDIKVLALDGELQVNNADNIRDEVIGLIDKKPLIISMEKCTYVSSAGLRALLMIAKTVADAEKELRG